MKNRCALLQQGILLTAVIGSYLMIQSCEETPTGPSSAAATIEGKVVQFGSLQAVQEALVNTDAFGETVLTDADGQYSFSIELPDTNSRTISLYISKDNFVADTVSSVVIRNGNLTSAPTAIIKKIEGTSREASNVVLVNIEANSVFVKGSGGDETTELTFEVRDDNGTPIDLLHQVKVCFRIEGGPGGGEFLSPDSVVTDEGGRVMTTINSGSTAGALQVVAEIQGKSIFSAPVPLAIHGWLPDAAHFSVVSDKLNFAGYNIFGLENKITAFVGDKFSNPVPPGTAVRFQSTGGIIEGSSTTDPIGAASVRLISTNPQPPGIAGFPSPFDLPGYALVTAQTVDEHQMTISKSTVVLFSGITQISNVNPTSFSIAPEGTQLFTFKASDQNDNPLVEGTSISVGTDEGAVRGDTNITLPDTQSRGFTQFSFVLTNSKPDSNLVKDATITIEVAGENGKATTFITGQMRPIN